MFTGSMRPPVRLLSGSTTALGHADPAQQCASNGWLWLLVDLPTPSNPPVLARSSDPRPLANCPPRSSPSLPCTGECVRGEEAQRPVYHPRNPPYLLLCGFIREGPAHKPEPSVRLSPGSHLLALNPGLSVLHMQLHRHGTHHRGTRADKRSIRS